MTDYNEDLNKILKMEATRSSAISYEGHSRDDRNFPGHLLVVVSPEVIYSFDETDIIDREENSGHRIRIWVRAGARGFRIARITTGAGSVLGGGPAVPFDIGMENIVPPPPVEVPGMPTAAIAAPRTAALEIETQRAFATPPISAIASYWYNSCAGGDVQSNNCAHYLSDAFIRAGYTELNPPNPYINARCQTTARRPIRARDMWSWFQSKARVTSRTVQRNTGWWAVFQLDESVYWGGHVAVLDSNAWVYYGTGWYPAWNQYCYQW
ncbi:hypothetical protein BFJ68_g16827 [Fusarium oxysporum]|uniref:Uncharacterized protein n=1 Tax=Fusarium oxysporum TaxID=5507 RepID=A0A420N0X0_FUSOX|nr:hypothetical protein BFJ71_g17353 [Fusarium oxysporum]RKK88936.1 hypothetical protein BFJ68_g16827 [Fusarium oxysporum]